MSTSIHQSSGRTFIHRGDIYYSPNCSRGVDVPEYTELYRYPFHLQEARFETFLTPRWWTRPYHYLCFVPLRYSFEGEVFGTLREFVTSIGPVGDRYGLSDRKISEWMDIENALLMVTHLLNKNYLIHVHGALRPPLPSFLGFARTFSEERTARFKVAASRNWFLMWMTLISSILADVNSIVNNEGLRDWFSILVEDHNVPQAWLSALRSSFICNFSVMHPRVGTFVNIQKPHPNQPNVKWFVEVGIPVWYRWNPSDSRIEIEHLRPPPEAFQSATTFISKNPSLPLPSTSVPEPTPLPTRRPEDYSAAEYQKAKNAYLASKPWEAYFAAREVENKKTIAKESDSQRITRLNWERNPPQVSCEVYEWEWSEDNSIELVRTSVPKKMRAHVLGLYSAAQSRYDSVRNRWDVCEYFGDDDSDDESDFSEDIGPDFPMSSDFPSNDNDGGAAESEALIDQQIDQMQRQPNHHHFAIRQTGLSDGPEISLSHSFGQVNIPQYMHYHYGFLRPIPTPLNEPPVGVTEWGECLKCIGLDAKVNPPIVGLSNRIIDFIKGMQGHGPPASDWDLRTDNYSPIDMTVLRNHFWKLPNGHFLLDNRCLRGDSQCNWQIALTTSANTLFVARDLINSTNQLSGKDLTQHLVEEGIPFCTYSKLEELPSSFPLSAIVTVIPRRGANYQFTVADYETYLSDRRCLLSTPRARAAILRGGIIGRLAKECIGLDEVLSGPSSAVNIYRLGHSVKTAHATYWDDALTKDEMSVICGMFYCHTGTKDQIAKVSWWPLPEYWDQSFNSFNWGHWTEWDEHWYQDHLSKIQRGEAVPLSHNQWRNKLKSASSWRKVTQFISTHSDQKCEAIPSV